jgi:hypothetical protein
MATHTPDLLHFPPGPLIVATGAVDFDENTAATHEVLAAVTGRKIQLVRARLRIAGACTITWYSGTSAIVGGTSEPFGSAGYYYFDIHSGSNIRTAEGEALQLAISAGVQVAGPIWYRLL